MPYATVLPLFPPQHVRSFIDIYFCKKKTYSSLVRGWKNWQGLELRCDWTGGSWKVPVNVLKWSEKMLVWDWQAPHFRGSENMGPRNTPFPPQILWLLEEKQAWPWPGSSAGSQTRHPSVDLTLRGPWHFNLSKQGRPGLAPSAQAETKGADWQEICGAQIMGEDSACQHLIMTLKCPVNPQGRWLKAGQGDSVRKHSLSWPNFCTNLLRQPLLTGCFSPLVSRLSQKQKEDEVVFPAGT